MHSRLSDAAAKHSHAVKMNIRHIPAMTVLDLRRSMSQMHLCAYVCSAMAVLDLRRSMSQMHLCAFAHFVPVSLAVHRLPKRRSGHAVNIPRPYLDSV